MSVQLHEQWCIWKYSPKEDNYSWKNPNSDAPPRAWSDLMNLQTRDHTRVQLKRKTWPEARATNDYLRGVAHQTSGLCEGCGENEAGDDPEAEKTRAKMIEFGKWRKEVSRRAGWDERRKLLRASDGKRSWRKRKVEETDRDIKWQSLDWPPSRTGRIYD